MYEAMTIAAEKGLTVMSHAEDMDLSPIDYRLAENLETVRNIYIAEATGAKLHMCHVSTKEAMEEVIRAKRRGVKVTSEVTPHHIWFYDNGFRVNPPIRKKRGRGISDRGHGRRGSGGHRNGSRAPFA